MNARNNVDNDNISVCMKEWNFPSSNSLPDLLTGSDASSNYTLKDKDTIGSCNGGLKKDTWLLQTVPNNELMIPRLSSSLQWMHYRRYVNSSTVWTTRIDSKITPLLSFNGTKISTELYDKNELFKIITDKGEKIESNTEFDDNGKQQWSKLNFKFHTDNKILSKALYGTGEVNVKMIDEDTGKTIPLNIFNQRCISTPHSDPGGVVVGTFTSITELNQGKVPACDADAPNLGYFSWKSDDGKYTGYIDLSPTKFDKGTYIKPLINVWLAGAPKSVYAVCSQTKFGTGSPCGGVRMTKDYIPSTASIKYLTLYATNYP